MWDSFYNLWLDNGGDSTVLLYLVHRQQYLKNKKPESQEYINLIRQITSILRLKYEGTYSKAISQIISTEALTDVYANFLGVSLPQSILEKINLTLGNITEYSVAQMLETMDKLDLSINTTNRHMQKIPESYWTHPVWILWCYIFDRPLSEAERYILVCYRFLFWYFLHREEYNKSAKVYILAINPLQRDTPLPLLSPEVLRENMLDTV